MCDVRIYSLFQVDLHSLVPDRFSLSGRVLTVTVHQAPPTPGSLLARSLLSNSSSNLANSLILPSRCRSSFTRWIRWRKLSSLSSSSSELGFIPEVAGAGAPAEFAVRRAALGDCSEGEGVSGSAAEVVADS